MHDLLALVSYLIDPVTIAPAGSGGRPVMVWASCGEAAKSAFAVTAPPAFPVAAAHATIQKEFRGSTAGIRAPDPATTDLLRYLDQIRADLSELKEIGVRLAIDDFGTGYSSLSYLLELPIDVLKIDKTFVTGIASSWRRHALVEGIVRLARTLEVEVIAEGIETETERELLAGMGCQLGQG